MAVAEGLWVTAGFLRLVFTGIIEPRTLSLPSLRFLMLMVEVWNKHISHRRAREIYIFFKTLQRKINRNSVLYSPSMKTFGVNGEGNGAASTGNRWVLFGRMVSSVLFFSLPMTHLMVSYIAFFVGLQGRKQQVSGCNALILATMNCCHRSFMIPDQ